MDKQEFFYKLVSFTTAVHNVKHEITKDIKADDITPLHYLMLEYIAVSQPVTLSQISDCHHISMPNASREIKKLCQKNLCEKYADPEDGRKQYVRLTAAGAEMMAQAFGQIEVRFLQRMKELSPEELIEIDHALDVLQSKVFY
jgi:DNA-binding MarR family transcriptional regulator